MGRVTKRRLTGSKVGLARRCNWWLRDDLPLPPDGPMDPSALDGNAFHECAQMSLLGRHVDVIAISAKHGADVNRVTKIFTLWAEWVQAERQSSWRPEAVLGYDPHGREGLVILDAQDGELRAHRDYSDVGERFIPMQSDVYALDEDWDGQYVTIIDWKSGVFSESHRDQVWLAALAAAKFHNADRAHARVIYANEDSISENSWWLGPDELHGFADAIYGVRQPIETPKPGSHCNAMYCPAATVCPETSRLLRSLVVDEKCHLTLLDNESAAAAWLNYERASRMLEAAREELNRYAKTCGIDLPDGRRVREFETNRKSAAALVDLLRKVGASESDIADLDMSKFDRAEGLLRAMRIDEQTIKENSKRVTRSVYARGGRRRGSNLLAKAAVVADADDENQEDESAA